MVGVFDLFKIGVGPSSSHTMGPMTAACRFAHTLQERGLLQRVTRVHVQLYGSLALTGRGHATDTAVMLGLCGQLPAAIEPDAAAIQVAAIRGGAPLPLAGQHPVAFDERRDIEWLTAQILPRHPNAVRFSAFAATSCIHSATFYSVGGGERDERGERDAREGTHELVMTYELHDRCAEVGRALAIGPGDRDVTPLCYTCTTP